MSVKSVLCYRLNGNSFHDDVITSFHEIKNLLVVDEGTFFLVQVSVNKEDRYGPPLAPDLLICPRNDWRQFLLLRRILVSQMIQDWSYENNTCRMFHKR